MSDRMHVATRKGLFTLDRSTRGTWSVSQANFLGDNCTMVMQDPRDQSIYAALGHGHFGVKLHRSTDDGRTWNEVGAPVYPELPEGTEPTKHPYSGVVIKWSLKMIWELRPGGADQDGVLWCGTLPGGLFKSIDHGASWSIVNSLWFIDEREEWFGGGYDEPGIHSVCVDPRNPDHLTVGISCGGAWRSEDAGATWSISSQGMRATYMPPEQAYEQNIQDPHLVVQCRDQPDSLWTQHHNGIFKTDDCCASWTEIEDVKPANFGFAVGVHPAKPETAWFVPGIKDEKRIPVDGKLIVNRTRDGGRTFEQLSDGLPQKDAYDIVFRHALDVDQTGDRIAFGSTTGSLWVTDNQGDDWSCINHHLPPVHVVRFA